MQIATTGKSFQRSYTELACNFSGAGTFAPMGRNLLKTWRRYRY